MDTNNNNATTSQTAAAAVRSAVASVATCTPATSALLKSLLLPKEESSSSSSTPAVDEPPSRTTSRAATARSRANTATSNVSRAPSRRGKTPAPNPPVDTAGGLSSRDKATLATQVINAALKALSEAAKASSTITPATEDPPPSPSLVKTATTRQTLRRTSSAPISPLQPRPLNRQSTSPSVPRHVRSPSKPSLLGSSPNLLSLVECARVALSTLRQIVTAGKVTLPELQLESGISALVSRLITLGLHEQAIRELRTLKRRLETLSGNEKKAPVTEPKTTAEAFSEILDFGSVKLSGPALLLAVTTQIQALRVLGLGKKPSAIEAVVAHLGYDKTCSPVRLLLQAAAEKGADKGKLGRQMETAAQCLLALCPSVSGKDDGVATEQRLSVSPGTALELQVLGLEMRLQWWEMVKHRGDVEKEVMVPLSRFLGAFIRRTAADAKTSYKVVVGAWERVDSRVRGLNLKPKVGSRMPLAMIYQTLATLAKEGGLVKEAVGWGVRLRDMIGGGGSAESVVKKVSVAAQLLGCQLKDRTKYLHDDGLIGEVVAGMMGPLRGDMSELDELLGNVVQARKAAISVLVVERKSEISSLQKGTRDQLEMLVLQTPRFCLRWLGKPPGPKGSTKDYLRYEQRRQLLQGSLQQNLESAFLVVKVRLEEGRMAWEVTDSVLGDCVTLLEYTGSSNGGGEGSSMYVKISHFYYLQYNALRQTIADPKDPSPLRALRRSVDCVKYRSGKEKEKAQLILKLERQSELAKRLGRGEEAISALFAIRTSLLEDGVLATVAKGLATQSPVAVWERDEKTEALSRALVAIAQVEQVWMDWTVDLSEAERAAALEHRLRYVLLRAGSSYTDVTLEHPCVDQLLRIYIPTRYPIRRLRVLLSLLCAALGKLDKAEELLAVAKDASQVEDLGEDTGLVGYLQHMKALFGSLAAAVDGYKNAGALRESVVVWQGIIKSCQDKAALEKQVDDVAGLLDYLQSIADFLRMKGKDEMLASVLELVTDISQVAATQGSKAEELIQHNSALAMQYTNLGRSTKAEQLFTKARQHLGPQASGDTTAAFYLACAEHAVALGDFQQAEEHLASARTAYTTSSTSTYTRLQKKQLVAYAFYLHSILAQEKGDSHHALVYSRESVRAIMAEWVKLEAQLVASSITSSSSSSSSSSPDQTDLSLATATQHLPVAASGPAFWKMFHGLFRNTMRLSFVYAHLGLFQETMYYAEQAGKIAGQVDSEFYNCAVAGWMGEVSWRSGGIEKAGEMLGKATGLFTEVAGEGNWFGAAELAVRLSEICVGVGNLKGGGWLLERAEGIVKGLVKDKGVEDVEEGMKKLKIEEGSKGTTARGGVGGRKVVGGGGVKKPVRKTGAAGARAAATKAKPVVKAAAPAPEPVVVVEDAQLAKLRASILVQKAVLMLKQKEWAGAQSILSEAASATTVKSSDLLPTRQLAMASCLLGMSMEQMAQDPVFSVIQDSTISFPALSGMERLSSVQASPMKAATSPKKGARAAGKGEGAKDLSQGIYVDNLREAHDYLLEAHSVASKSGDSALIHKISGMLQHVGLFLTATSSSRTKATIHSAQTSYSVELARNLIWRRERKAMIQEKHAPRHDGTEWPPALQSVTSRRSSLGFTLDLHKVQRDYIDIVPKNWNVISIALSEGNQDLCITKLQAGQNPFVIRLPLERATSRDADSDVFNFQQGRSELLDIIKEINATCHSAKDMNQKGAKTEWWNAREALDERLKELLENIEQIWLGGFRGIFSQHCRRADLLARFQKSFLAMMDKHLPSRRQVRGKKTKAAAAGQKVQLDLNILELFIGLGDATRPGTDFDDELTDLLYFVVDILQFHGERNAYDEIDFDSMVVETFDALMGYHSAVNEGRSRSSKGGEEETGIHTVLLLDKALHVFPWESLPCMQGLAISRMPSLACLRRLILEQRLSEPPVGEGGAGLLDVEGHHVDFGKGKGKGAYILNPSGDLAATQKTFGPALEKNLSSFESIISRPPTEPEFERFLAEKDLLLYFGHGSGAQYIRGRTIRRLDRCKAAVLLMGCSSAALTEAGEFEPSGPAWNYMLSGSPAVVGTLWDVTDRDIDRFAGRMLETWGVLPKGAVEDDGKGRDTGKGKRARGDKKRSLVEAVAEAREGGCRFRYVTAAGVVVYGVPVYVWKE